MNLFAPWQGPTASLYVLSLDPNSSVIFYIVRLAKKEEKPTISLHCVNTVGCFVLRNDLTCSVGTLLGQLIFRGFQLLFGAYSLLCIISKELLSFTG